MKFFRKVVALQTRRKLLTYNICLSATPAKELFGRKAVGQILQIYKILSVLHIFIYFRYFFKSMYSYHEMVTFMQIDTEAANAWWSKK